MAASSSVVIKVKHGDLLRRFSTQIVGDGLNLTMNGLRKKIISLFSFDVDAELFLTYVDEDGDDVTLADDEDLRDVVKQGLNPLRITVKVNAEKDGHCTRSSANSLSSVLPHVQLVNHLAKLGLSYLDQLSLASQPGGSSFNSEGGIHVSNPSAKETRDLGISAASKDVSGVRPDNESMGKITPKVTLGSDEVVSNPGEPKAETKTVSFGAVDPATGDSFDNRMKSDDLGNNLRLFSTTSPGSYFPGINSGSVPAYQCPFSGLAMGNGTAVSQPVSEVGPVGWSISQNDCRGKIFHPGVRCDGCGVHPIIGPRFKSKVKVDYDLCNTCFEVMGNRNDYTRMDRPAVYRPHVSLSGLHDAYQQSRDRSPFLLQQVRKRFKVKPVVSKPDSLFIRDVNIYDGTVMLPSIPFTKIWRIRNTGTIVWPKKTQLVWIGGDKMSNELTVEVQIPSTGLQVDEELDVAVDFISPKTRGRYVSYWRMALPSGHKFGQRFWVVILVNGSLKESPLENIRDLNLNLPPVSSPFAGPEIYNVGLQPMVEDGPSGAHNSKSEKLPLQPNSEQELKFPINDSLLVGAGASSSYRPSQKISYPIIDLCDIVPHVTSVPPTTFHPQHFVGMAPVTTAQETNVELPTKMEVEEKLLKELEEMGFKDVGLNKRMLRKNEYDLEQAVDDLCGVTDWDPILEELQEMGFHDAETNKMLLKKNNGSIKRVVMDLIASEKIE